MSEWLTRVLNESESKGMEKGAIQMLWSLVKDGLLTMEVAAARAGLTEEEFQARATAMMSESASKYDQEKN